MMRPAGRIHRRRTPVTADLAPAEHFAVKPARDRQIPHIEYDMSQFLYLHGEPPEPRVLVDTRGEMVIIKGRGSEVCDVP